MDDFSLIEHMPPAECLKGPKEQEQAQQNERKAVIAKEILHEPDCAISKSRGCRANNSAATSLSYFKAACRTPASRCRARQSASLAVISYAAIW